MTFSMTRAPQIQDQTLLILLQVSRTLGEFRIVIGGLFHNLNSSSCVASSSSFVWCCRPKGWEHRYGPTAHGTTGCRGSAGN